MCSRWVCFPAAVLELLHCRSPLSLVPQSTSITWERTPHPVRRLAFSLENRRGKQLCVTTSECAARKQHAMFWYFCRSYYFALASEPNSYSREDHLRFTEILTRRISLRTRLEQEMSEMAICQQLPRTANPNHVADVRLEKVAGRGEVASFATSNLGMARREHRSRASV